MARRGRFELPTFWSVVRQSPLSQPTTNHNNLFDNSTTYMLLPFTVYHNKKHRITCKVVTKVVTVKNDTKKLKVQRVTDRKLKSLKPKSDYYRVAVTGSPGLSLRVEPSGTIVFRYRYQLAGRRREVSIGSYPAMALKDLELKYSTFKNHVKNGLDPLEEKRKSDCNPANKTVSELSVEYLEDCESSPKKRGGRRSPATIKEYKRIIDRYVLKKWPGIPAFGEMKVSEINVHNIKKLIKHIATKMPNTYKGKGTKGAPTQANRVLEVFSGMCNFAIDEGILEQNPTSSIKKYEEKVRNRFLTMGEWDEIGERDTVNEIKLVYDVLQESGSRLVFDAFMVALHTGQRVKQIAKLRMDYIENGRIVFPLDEMKGRKTHEIYLSPQVKKIIDQRVADGLTTDFVFPGIKPGDHVHPDSLKTALARLQPKVQAAGVPHFSFHDLRRTLSTQLQRLGFRGVDGDILSHSRGGVTEAHYNRHKPIKEIKRALTVWGEEVQRALDGSQTNVVSINQNIGVR